MKDHRSQDRRSGLDACRPLFPSTTGPAPADSPFGCRPRLPDPFGFSNQALRLDRPGTRNDRPRGARSRRVALARGLRVAALALAMVAPAHAAFQPFGLSEDREPTFRATGVLESFEVEVEVPGIEVRESEEWTFLTLPGHSRIMVPGQPELPLLNTSVMLPDRGTPRVTLTVLDEVELELAKPVAPSQGHFTRDISPADRPRVPGAVYEQDTWVPAEDYAAAADTPYIVRDARGATLRISPVLYNPAAGRVRILRKARLEVEVEAGALGVNELHRRSDAVSADFMPLYSSLFTNFESSGFTEAPTESVGHALVIVPDQWEASLEPLNAWRAQKGLPSRSVPYSQVGTTAQDIKSFLQAEYDAGGLTYVLLVGDSEFLPTLKGENEGADCDACMVKLEGTDHVPDVLISRFSAKTTAEVDVQVARAVKYERDPVVGDLAGFYRKAVGIASNEGTPPDFERVGYLRTALLDWRFDAMDELYDEPGWFGDKVEPEEVQAAVNEGRSLIAYMGHGSKKAWVTSDYSVSHVHESDPTTGAWPMIWDVACVNGDFVGGSDCFGEAWAKAGTAANPKGAIGIVAASTNMSWDPPVDWQNAVVTQYFIPEKAYTGGSLHLFGLMKAMEQWGSDEDSEGVMMVEQCIYFGDASVVLRSDRPRQAAVAWAEDEDTGEWIATVTAGDAPVRAARVVVRSERGELVGVTGAAGAVRFPAGIRDGEGVTCTVTGPNLVPVLERPLAPPAS